MVAPRDVRVLPKKGGWGAGPLTLPGGIGYQYTRAVGNLSFASTVVRVTQFLNPGLTSLQLCKLDVTDAPPPPFVASERAVAPQQL